MITHTITVRNRRIAVDRPRLIQGCKGSDAVVLDLDEEWSYFDTVLVHIGSDDFLMTATYDGTPMELDTIDFPIGYLPVSVYGTMDDGSKSIVTARAPHAFSVVRNGRSEQ